MSEKVTRLREELEEKQQQMRNTPIPQALRYEEKKLMEELNK